jgi:uncharacterized membrane protein YidH (DUF202 family)
MILSSVVVSIVIACALTLLLVGLLGWRRTRRREDPGSEEPAVVAAVTGFGLFIWITLLVLLIVALGGALI